jgi:hypothetical protein
MIKERYYYAVAAFLRKDGKLAYTSVTSSVKWEEDGVKPIWRLDQLTVRLDSNGKPHIQYGSSVAHYFKKVDYIQLFCRNGSEIRAIFKKCAGFSIETTEIKKNNGFVEFKPKNFVVHLK